MIDFSKIDPKDCYMANPIESTHTEGWADMPPYSHTSVYEDIKTGLEQAIAYEKNTWVVTENGCVITCPKCGERLELCYPDGTEVRYLPHCPWCGKKLEEQE